MNTIEDALPRKTVIADGSLTEITLDFPLFSEEFMLVYLNDTKAEGFSVDLAENKVVLGSAPEQGTVINVVRVLPISYTTILKDRGAMSPSNWDSLMVEIVAKMQTLKEAISRTIQLPIYTNSTGEAYAEEFFNAFNKAMSALSESEKNLIMIESSVVEGQTSLTQTINQGKSEVTQIYTEAISNINTKVSEAQGYANTASEASNAAQSWAIGDIESRPEGSAKYWAESISSGGMNNNTNCLTKVPQISWSLSDDIFTFPTGTKAYKPDGTVITLDAEKTVDFSTQAFLSHPKYAYVDDEGNIYAAASAVVSNEIPVGVRRTNDIWFDTANNVIKRYDGADWVGSHSFPLIYINSFFGPLANSIITFSGRGFIEGLLFILPGVEGLIPNGRNADGSLKTTAFTVTTPLTHQLEDNNEYVILLNGSSLSTASYSGNSYYDNESSTNSGVAAGYVEAGICSNMTNVVKNFSLKSVFCALDYAEFQQNNEGIQKKIDELQESIVARLPAGFVAAWPGNTPPDGWLVCNGATISRTTYADLFAAIGTTFGAGDGSTTFKIPDYQGDFLRGYLSGTSSAIGTRQAEGLPNITGNFGADYAYSVRTATGAFRALAGSNRSPVAQAASVSNNAFSFNASRSNGLYGDSSHVTPRNNAVKWCIKY